MCIRDRDEIDHNLGRGSGYSHGSFRIYDYFQEKHDSKEAAEFLKKEYGIGGGSHALAGADHSWQDHNFKGIELKKGNICEPYAKVLLSWKVVEKRIRKLVAEDKYLSPAGKEAYARYKAVSYTHLDVYKRQVLKVGRVQTPTLAMLVDREVKIMNFEKEQYYMAHILMDGIDAMTERIDDKARAESIAAACESQSLSLIHISSKAI